MIRIICTKCKNAYLQNKDGNWVCPSCEATYSEDYENLLLGVQYYNEENYTECDNCLMKFIVKNGAEPFAIVYKALCDARNFDEDTLSLKDTYKKIIDALSDVSDNEFPQLIAIANDEAEKIEKLLSENHIRLFADADAEKIKKQVEIILNIQSEAKAFRVALSTLVSQFNERSERKISAKFADCFFVESDIAAEVGEIKYQKICDNVASHTVFTGILTNDIKNLEIYYRCIVMFFQKSYDKYKFLLEQSEKFIKLAEMLEAGQYNTIKGTGSIADKLKSISYEFLQESYKEHFDDQIDEQTETIVIIEPEIIEEPQVEEETTDAEEIPANTDTGDIKESVEPEAVAEVEATEDSTESTFEAEDSTEISVEPEEVSDVEADDVSVEEVDNTIITEDFIEIEVDDSVEENAAEIEDISSASETEIVEETETANSAIVDNTEEEEAAEAELAENTAVEAAIDDIIEIEAAPQYEVVDCDLPEISEDEDIVVENIESEKTDTEGKSKKAKKKNSHKGILLLVFIILLAGLLAGYKYIPGFVKDYKYKEAVALADSGKYSEAITAFEDLGEYSDSQEKALECGYNYAVELEKEGKFAEAKLIFENLDNYGDASTKALACYYSEGKDALENKNFKVATKIFMDLGDYGDSEQMVKECSYQNALSLIENKEYKSAIEILTAIRKYSDAKDKILEAKYMYVTDNFDKKNKTTVKYLNELTKESYRNSADLRTQLLGSSEVLSEDIKAVVNYSATDLETALTELDNTREIYFHAIVSDKNLYGKTLTLKYTTAFGYTQRKNVVLSESDNVAVMSYPSTQHKNYTVEFELLDSDGQKIAGQKISF